MRRVDIVHEGTTHGSNVSMWNKRAHSLCGKIFAPGDYRELLLRGGLTCDDCKKAGRTKTKS